VLFLALWRSSSPRESYRYTMSRPTTIHRCSFAALLFLQPLADKQLILGIPKRQSSGEDLRGSPHSKIHPGSLAAGGFNICIPFILSCVSVLLFVTKGGFSGSLHGGKFKGGF
jgi:hypothetical protein